MAESRFLLLERFTADHSLAGNGASALVVGFKFFAVGTVCRIATGGTAMSGMPAKRAERLDRSIGAGVLHLNVPVLALGC